MRVLSVFLLRFLSSIFLMRGDGDFRLLLFLTRYLMYFISSGV